MKENSLKNNIEFEIIDPKTKARENQIRRDISLGLLNTCQSVFDRLFPSSVDREVMKWKRKIISQEAQHSVDIADMIHEFQTKALREMANVSLISGSTAARKKYLDTFRSLSVELSKVAGEEILCLTKKYDEWVKEAAKIENDNAREIQVECLKNIFEDTIDSIGFSIEHFKEISKNLMV